MPSGRLPIKGSLMAMAAGLSVEVAAGSAGIAAGVPLLEEVVLPGGGAFPKLLGWNSPYSGSPSLASLPRCSALQPLSSAKANRAPDQHAKARQTVRPAPRAFGVFPLSCALCILTRFPSRLD